VAVWNPIGVQTWTPPRELGLLVRTLIETHSQL
jgi:hypothetical protein